LTIYIVYIYNSIQHNGDVSPESYPIIVYVTVQGRLSLFGHAVNAS